MDESLVTATNFYVVILIFLHYLHSSILTLTLTPKGVFDLADAPDFPPIITTETGLSYIQVVHAS